MIQSPLHVHSRRAEIAKCGAGLSALVMVCSLLFNCGKEGGEETKSQPAPTPTPGIVDTSIKTIAAMVYVGDTTHPAKGYELWTLDHTGATFRRDLVSDTGSVSLPTGAFTVGSVYTMHLVKDGLLIADVDLSAAAAVQAAFTYLGGPGFDLGNLILDADEQGALDLTQTSVRGVIGGGFSAQPESTKSFQTFPAPAGLTRLAIGSQLYVFEPSSLLHSFYQRAQNPTLYAQDLASYSRVGIHINAASADIIRAAQLEEAGPWLTAARLALADDDPPRGAGALWSASDFKIAAADKKDFSASVLAGALLPSRSMILMRVRIGDTDPDYLVPRMLGAVVAVPPLLQSIDLGSGTLAAVDYTATSGANGLTRPFCRAGALRLGVVPPKDDAGLVISASLLDTIVVAPDYYGVAANGKVLALAVTPGDFPLAWQASATDTIGDSQRLWDPSASRFTITLGTADAARAVQVLPFPADLFMASVASGGVAYVRLRIYFKSAAGATESAFAVWFNNTCM